MSHNINFTLKLDLSVIIALIFLNVRGIITIVSVIVVIILGIIQGVTEFLPVSSSGHVLIVSKLLGDIGSFEFDVLVSFGTVLAVVLYYRKRLLQIARDIIKKRDFRLLLMLIVATIPAVLAGLALESIIKTYLHNPLAAVIMLVTIGLLMIWSRHWQPKEKLPVNKDLRAINLKQSLLIGLAQCISLISGSSRSGVTILAALRLGFTKKVAAEWSFLMSIPVILGASLKVLFSDSGQRFVADNTTAFILSNVVSFVAGIAAIHILMKILKKKGLYWFGWYRIVLGLVLLVLIFAKIIT